MSCNEDLTHTPIGKVHAPRQTTVASSLSLEKAAYLPAHVVVCWCH